MNTRASLSLLAAVALLFVPGTSAPTASVAHAQAATQIRLVTLAPRGSPPYRVFTAWNNSLREQTAGRLELHVVPGSSGDERQFVRDLRAGTVDAAALTSIGLAQIARSVLVLQAPGVAEDYPELDRVRAALDVELRHELESNGVVLLGWGEAGRVRVFSTHPITSPAELAAAHPWQFPGDDIFGEFLHQIGATGVPLPLAGVLPALTAGTVDVVVGSATAVTALQWHTHVTHVIEQSRAILVGATVYDAADYHALSAADRTVLDATAAQAHARLQSQMRTGDDGFYTTLTAHGITPVAATAHDAEWRQAAQRTRDALVGRVYSRALLDRALAAAAP